MFGEASDGEGALELCLRLKPDVLITDLRLPKKNGILLIHELKALLPGTSVIVHTGSESATMLSLARDAQPAAILHSDDGLTGLRKAFEAAMTGEWYISKAVVDQIKWHAAEVVLLTRTELAVLSCLVRSQQTKGIAASIKKSERSVAAHRESLYKKTGTHEHARPAGLGDAKRAGGVGECGERHARALSRSFSPPPGCVGGTPGGPSVVV